MTSTPTKTTAAPAPARPQGLSATASIDPIKVLRAHAAVLIVAAIVGGALGAGAYLLADRFMPRYQGEVIFEVTPGLREATDVAAADISQEDQVVRLARTEIARLMTPDLFTSVLRTSDAMGTSWMQQFKDDRFVGDDGMPGWRMNDAVDTLMSELSADVVRSANAFKIVWEAPAPGDVPVILNGLARTFIDSRRASQLEGYKKASQDFASQLDALKSESIALEQEIRDHIETHQLRTLTDARDTEDMVSARDIEQQYNTLQIQRSNLEAQIAALESSPADGIELTITDDERQRALNDPNLRALQATINDLRVALTTADQRFGAEHPQVKHYRQMLAAAEKEQLLASNEWVKKDRVLRATVLRDQLRGIEGSIEELKERREVAKARLMAVSQAMGKLAKLQANLQSNKLLQEQLMEAQQQTAIMRSRDEAALRVNILRSAERPRSKSFPTWQTFIPGGAMAALALVLGVVFLREFLDQRVKSSRDLAVIPGARVIGSVPDLDDDPTGCPTAELAVRDHPSSVVAESYRQANAAIMREMLAGAHSVLLVVGGMPGCGTTTVVTNLGATDAAAGRRVLLVDANFRRPRLAAAIGVAEDGPGLGDLLGSGDMPVEDGIMDVGGGLHLMHAGTPSSRVLERINSPRFDSILATLRPMYDLVIIDAPPAVVAGEAMVLASKADAAVLVVRAHQEQRGLVARLVHQLADARCQLLGIVLNRPRGQAGGYLKKNYAAMAEYARTT